jgi:hypothetical protein
MMSENNKNCRSKEGDLRSLLYKLAVFFVFTIIACSCKQNVLLIGTHHTTPDTRVSEVIPIAAALKRFHPEVICAEYLIPTDTPSLLYRGGDKLFENTEAKRIAWNVSADHGHVINSLQHYLRKHPLDFKKRIELQQRYFLSHDMGNADYQRYLIMKNIAHDSAMTSLLGKLFTDYKTLKLYYDAERVRKSEYQILVFPLAEVLNISYIYPIDDLSTWKSYEIYYDRLQVRDTTDSVSMKYHKRLDDFRKMLASLPNESNQWVLSNSALLTKELLSLESYIIDPDDSSHADLKMMHHYWVLRNRIMASHIDKVARKHPHKNLAVFFGVSHVGPVQVELNKLKKKYHVLTLPYILKYPDKH